MSGSPWDAVSVAAGAPADATPATPAANDPWDAVSYSAAQGKVPVQAQAQAPGASALDTGPAPAPPMPVGQALATGLGKDARSVMHGVGDIVDFVPDVMKAFWNLPGDVTQMVTGHDMGPRVPLHVTRDAADKIADQLGLPKDQNTLDRIGGAIIEGVTASTGIGGALSALKGAPGFAGVVGDTSSSPVANAVTGGAGAAAAQGTAEAGGGPVAQTVAGMLGGMAPHVVPHVGGAVVGAATRVAEPFAAGMSTDAAQAAAGRRLASAATNPEAAAAALSQPGEIVPGSQPTTYQQSGDPGLGALEREAFTRNNAPFQERAAQQNEARVQALGDIQKGADPNDVAATLRQHFEDLDAGHEATVQAATKAAQDKAAAFGGALPPDQYGQIIRDAMQTGERGAAAHVGSFYDAIDPEGNLTGNLQETRAGAQKIASEVGPTSKPMTADEADIFDKAMSLPDIAPASQLIELRKYVNAVARDPAVAGTPTSARLTQLRNVIDSNLANTISQQIANEAPAVARGALDPSQSMAAKVKSEVDAWRAQRTSALAASDGSTPPSGEGRAPTVPGVPGADSQAGEVAGGRVGGNPPVPRTPSFDESARQRLIAANQAAKEKAQVWGPKAIESILAKDGNGNFRVPDGKVADAFFHPGASGFQHMQQALRASPESLPAFIDHAATTLRRAHMNPDGTLDPAGFQRWHKAYADALRALPEEARAKFADAASATQALADARAARTASLKAAQAGAIGKVMKLTEPEDVTRTIGSILNGRTAVADMKALALATKGNPEARAGLRQAVADYMSKRLIGNTEVGTSGVPAIKGDAYQTFIKNAKPALNLIFTPEEVSNMEAIAEDIQRANRSLNSKPAGTPGSAHDVLKGLKKAAGHGKSMLDVVGALLGEHAGGPAGLIAGAVGTHLLQALHGAGVARIDGLVTEAMLNPKLAAELLKKAPPKLSDASMKGLTVALVKAVPSSNPANATQN